MSSKLPLVLKAEKNVIYLLLGRRTIKKLVGRIVGKNGAALVDQCYKLAEITLGKRPAKKFIQNVLHVIAEISVLAMHRRLTDTDLDIIRRCVCHLANQFKAIHTSKDSDLHIMIRISRGEWVTDMKKDFVREVRRTEIDLIRLLLTRCQPSTLARLHHISKTIRDPEIVNVCFQKTDSELASLMEQLIETAGKIDQDQAEKYALRPRSRSHSKSKSKSKAKRTMPPPAFPQQF